MQFTQLPTYQLACNYWKLSSESPSGLVWIKSPAKRIKIGQVAGTLHFSGYWEVCLKGITYKAHRIIYLLQNKISPGNFIIDHANGKKDIFNLRLADHVQNCHNRGKCKSKTSSKYKGVYWSKQRQKWKARIYVNKKQIWLGYFKKENDAALAYNKAALKYLGNFAFLNDVTN